MTEISTCPDEHELLPIAIGEPADEAMKRHIDACPACGGRMDRLRADLAALRDFDGGATGPDPAAGAEGKPVSEWMSHLPMAAARARAEGRPERPVAIGKYVVIELLDWGGEADVYQVIHPNLGKEMVLKLAHRPVVGDERAALVAEGRVLIDLEHINLVRVFDSGFHDDRPFLVMEYVHGRNLEQYARDETATPRRAAELVARLAGALAMVHRKDIIHRDIKPRNILIDDAGEPRLIDFGLARLRNAWSDPFATTWGGTLPFMAPEQARREHDRIGPRSDIFGLGAVLYFLLTGQPPFVGETREEIEDRARRCDFEPHALRIAKVPSRLARICLKALAADPADRYATGEEFGRALRGFLRWPTVVAIGAAILSVAAIAAAVGSRAWPESPAADNPTIDVHRGDEIIEHLREAVPLRTGDQVRIRCAVPAAFHVSAFWYDSEGRLAQLVPLSITRGRRSDHVVYPRPDPSGDVVPLTGPSGTELLLICGRLRGEATPEEVRPLFAGVGRLPGVGHQTYLLFDSESVQAHGARGLGDPEPSRVGDALAVLDSIRQKLRERFDFVAGLAIPHADAGPAPAARALGYARPHPAPDRPAGPE